ncbi:hypothetical protein ACOME3_004545 [Neoechinorhynchus agilis]
MFLEHGSSGRKVSKLDYRSSNIMFICIFAHFLVLVLIIGRICHFSRRRSIVMYYIKISYYLLFTGIVSPILILPCLNKIGDPRNIDMVCTMLCGFYGLFFGLRVKVIGSKKGLDVLRRSDTGSFVVVANHQSGIDFITMANLWPLNCTVLMKKSLFYLTGPFGILCCLCGIQFISRGNQNDVKFRMRTILKNITEKGWRILIFPEGTRTADAEMKPFKQGAFKLAIHASVPIVPVVIANLNGVYSHRDKYWVPGEIEVCVLDPIEPDDFDGDAMSLAESTRAKMMNVWKTLKSSSDYSDFNSD